MTKIIPRILGGIGNQLFCYAAARRMALVNNAELVIDDVSGFAYDRVYQRHYQLDHFSIPCRRATPAERLEPFAKIRRYLKRTYEKFRPLEKRTYLVQEGRDFDSRLLHVKSHGTVYLEGYWQSEEYFKDVAATIRHDLQITPPVDAYNLAMADKIRGCNSIALHVRFFSNPRDGLCNNAPEKYYTRAIKYMVELTPEAHFFVFSDRPEIVQECISLPAERITLVTHNQGDENAYADMWLMSLCKHFIIANSTFSWWGAWLAAHPDKIVIAPGFEIRSGVAGWGFKGLLPEEWIKL